MPEYDVIVIPSGGLQPDGTPHPWVRARLDKAFELRDSTQYFVSTSAWTVHKPPIMDSRGFPVTEAQAGSDYLLAKGIRPDRLLNEAFSLDTIGNAYFLRTVHIDPLGLRKMLVITSNFHMKKTQWIFEKIFALEPYQGYELSFLSTPDNMDSETLALRMAHEKRALDRTKADLEEIGSLQQFHHWLYQKHGAYSNCLKPDNVEGKVVDSY
jgi:hypothetical protein